MKKLLRLQITKIKPQKYSKLLPKKLPLNLIKFPAKKKLLKLPTMNFSMEKTLEELKEKSDKTRNIAIIAHVDHGKTTLLDSILKSTGEQFNNDRLMDSHDLEKEKGITINSKVTSMTYKDYTINIVDTPGHQDFGGEVERILSMVDGVILVVCGTEGTKRQTKFVLQKAIEHNLMPLVVVNKIDRDTCDLDIVQNSISDLVCDVAPDESYLEYDTLYTSAVKEFLYENEEDIGKEDKKKGMNVILERVIDYFPAPKFNEDQSSFQMLATQLHYDNHFGKYVTGKVVRGYAKIGDQIKIYDQNKKLVGEQQITRITKRKGLVDFDIQELYPGDIASLAGLGNAKLTYNLSTSDNPEIIKSTQIDPPLIQINIYANSSPLAGKTPGTKSSFNEIQTRIEQECEKDVALFMEKTTGNALALKGRGELHLGILLENMRREGYELEFSSPTIIYQTNKNGEKLEPIERIYVDVGFDSVSSIMDKIMKRLGTIEDNFNLEGNEKQRIIAKIPSRGLLGLIPEIVNETQGDYLLESQFLGYELYYGEIEKSRKNFLISSNSGKSTIFGLNHIQKFGEQFLDVNQDVYTGQIIGFSKDQEQVINPCKEKKLSNIRTVFKDEAMSITPPKRYTIEEAMGIIQEEELVEIQPHAIRIRKKTLDKKERQRNRRNGKV